MQVLCFKSYLTVTRFYAKPNGELVADASGNKKQAVYLHLDEIVALVQQEKLIKHQYAKG